MQSTTVMSYTFAGSQCLQFNVLNTGNVYQFSSPENTGNNGESLGTVTCTENGGASLAGPVTYAILQPVSVPFVFDSSSGILSLQNEEILDYEQTQQYIFDVSCSYDSDSSINATASVTFLVGPVNEFKPVFSDVSLQVSISELTPFGMVLVARDSSGTRQYTVSDEDSGPDGVLRFLPSSANPPELNQDFSLSMDGSLILTQTIELDSGVTSVRRVTYQIRVCDGNRVEADCPSLDVVLLIRSDNDNLPMFEQDKYTVTVSESVPIGTSLITVVCTDADRNGVGEFSGITVGEPNAPVLIPNERNGTVFLQENLDFENSPVVTATLVCLDSGGLQDIAMLMITIIPDVSEETSSSTNTEGIVSGGKCIIIMNTCIHVCTLNHQYTAQPSPLVFTDTDLGLAVSVSVVVTAAFFMTIGFLTGLLVTHLCSLKKAAEGQANIGPTSPTSPVYEEVSPKEVELTTNQAYESVRL